MTAPPAWTEQETATAGEPSRPVPSATAQAGARPGPAPAEQPSADDADAGARLRLAWRRWRVPLALIGVIVLGGIAIAIIGRLVPPARTNAYLDPASSAPDGTHALTDILGERGDTVISAYSPASAIAALRAGSPQATGATEPVTLVVTSPYLLTRGQLARLGRARADLLVVEPGPRALAALAPAVTLEESAVGHFAQLLEPGCDFAAARLAGSANTGGASYHGPASGSGCYLLGGSPTVLRYRAAGRTITVMGSGAPLVDGRLARNGNAALALNLLAGHRRVIWLTPEPSLAPPPPDRSGQAARPAPALIPWQAWLVVIQLAIAAALTGLWRARRLGPLISERLPVVVRASETVEGHAALYQYRRARDRAAAALREDMLGRMLPVLGLVKGAPQEAVTDAVSARSRHGRQEVARILFGHAPGTDQDLVNLARSLDELEREVCTQ